MIGMMAVMIMLAVLAVLAMESISGQVFGRLRSTLSNVVVVVAISVV